MSALAVIRAAHVALPDGVRAAAVRVRDGRVEAVLPYDHPDTRDAEDLGGQWLLPGLVDTHVHVNEPGRTAWEGFRAATRAAAAGGVTTLVDMPLNSIPATLDVAALEVKRRVAQGCCYVDVGFWGGAVPGNQDRLGPLWDAGVFGFKCFLVDSGVPEFPALDRAGLHTTGRSVASFGGLLLVHAEDGSHLATPPAGSTRYADFLASRPDSSEVAAIADVVDAARRTGCRAHVVHLSTAGALPLLTAARADGVPVTVETCPHYLTLAAEEVPDGGTEFKCCPPIREAANRDRLWRALADGQVDCVVSDHSPCPAELKHRETGRFADAWGGIGSLQLGLPVVWTEARRRGHTLAEVARWMAAGPAALAGLDRKGRIAVGADADLCLVAPDEPFVVEPERLQHRSPLTPYAGRTVTGVVRGTWLAGRRVDLDTAPRGRLLRRGGAG